ncbi:MAG TPA: hypothetical protein VG847_10665 [Chitinophagaceae bacterium]|nr:hypothetical protein [Chitinophagaceae bacterium]
MHKSVILALTICKKVKKITALFFLLIFMFNLFGYRIFLTQMQKKADQQLEARLDNDSYDDAQLVELKVPLNLPYTNSYSGYARCDGQIDISGTLYKYVKRKIVNDTLYLMCIPNTQAMHFEVVKNDFFKMVNDLGMNKNSQKSSDSKNISKNQQSDYDQYSFSINILLQCNDGDRLWFSGKGGSPVTSVHTAKGQPPDLFI